MEKINHFLQAISWGDGQRMDFSFNSYNPETDKFFRHLFLVMFNILEQWNKYLDKKGKTIRQGNINTFGMLLSEAINNANDHGNAWDPAKKINVTIWTGEKGTLAGIKDEGDFFRKESMKTCIEKRVHPEGPWQPKGSKNARLGFSTIFCADELYVDTDTGFLYIMWLFK